jgi:RimJ/RimL family protein N-acetyltransferase
MGMARVYCQSTVERWQAPVLEASLVRLEPLAQGHIEGLWQASRDPRVWNWLPVLQPETADAMQAWLDDAIARREAGLDIPFATVSAASGSVVGSTRYLALRPEHRTVEIGWTWLSPAAWGTGANQEAKLLQLRHAFEAWDCQRVELKTDELNTPARGSMEDFGAVFEGIHRRHMLVRDGVSRSSAWYSVLVDEWPDVEARLLRSLDSRSLDSRSLDL